jgi:hypothetical protein
MARSLTPFPIADLRGGRNGSDPPLSLPDDQCVEALNVDWREGTLAHKRAGAAAIGVTFSSGGSGGSFGDKVNSMFRHVPGTDETAAELWAVAGNAIVGRLAGGTSWVEPMQIGTLQSSYGVVGVSFAGYAFIASNTSLNRLRVWDSSDSAVRLVGLATPDPPSVATQGGTGLSFTRHYRIRTVDISGSDTKRRSEASTSVSITITDDAGVTVTRPTLPANEGETHWEVEYAEASTGPWYRASQVATGTSTYSDTASAVDTTTLSPADGINYPPPSAKYLIKDSARLVMAGAWETSGGYTTPKDTRIWWTPPNGASDVGDAERVPTGYWMDVEATLTGLGGPLDGTVYAFGYRHIWLLVPTGLTGANAYQRYTLSSSIGCIRHESIVMAEDENGASALYFLSHRGPYRIGRQGLQYLGHDIEDVWATVNLEANTTVVAHGVYHADAHQIWYWVATGSNNEPDTRLVFDTQLGRSDGARVTRGWSKHTGESCEARCSVMFSSTLGASMSRALKPHIGQRDTNGALWKCDTGTDDAGTDFQAYVETKEYAPAGIGRYCSLESPVLVAEAASGVTIQVMAREDFGIRTASSTALLTATGSETHVVKPIADLQTGELQTVRFRIGDSAAADNAWTLDALVMRVNAQETRP